MPDWWSHHAFNKLCSEYRKENQTHMNSACNNNPIIMKKYLTEKRFNPMHATLILYIFLHENPMKFVISHKLVEFN